MKNYNLDLEVGQRYTKEGVTYTLQSFDNDEDPTNLKATLLNESTNEVVNIDVDCISFIMNYVYLNPKKIGS